VLLNAEHKAANTNWHRFQKYGWQRILTEFSKINCKSEGPDTLKKHSRNRKHRPQAWKLQNEAHAYWRECERCGWMAGLLNQEDQTRRQSFTRQISRETWITV